MRHSIKTANTLSNVICILANVNKTGYCELNRNKNGNTVINIHITYDQLLCHSKIELVGMTYVT